MGEYRMEDGSLKSQGEIRKLNPSVSIPKVWNADVCASLNIDAVLASPAATTTQYQISVRDGVEQDANGNWMEKYVAKAMFAATTDEDGVKTTKAQHEAAYQAGLDATVAEGHRTTRNKLLADSDWTQVNDSPLSNEVKTAWATYRQECRGLSDVDAWPNLEEADWPVSP